MTPSPAPSEPQIFLEDQRLRKVERLTKRAHFLEAQRQGRRRAGLHLVVYARPNGLGWPRLGLTTSRKVGNAVCRNRWRRLLREAFRTHKAALPLSFDLVVIVKPQQQAPALDVLTQELLALARRASEDCTRARPSG